MLTLRKEFEIKKKAEELLKKHNLNSAPIDLKKILEAEKIKYFERDLTSLDPDKNIEALLLSDDTDSKIVLNTAIEERYSGRKNFTIAHEIGHFFLHTEKGKPYIAARKNKTGLLNVEEEEANKFASHLLMPDSLVEDAFFSLSSPTLKNLAEIFKVSEKAMSKKLIELGLRLHA